MTGPTLPLRDLDHVLTYTQGAWDDLSGGKLLLTGGNGFVGRWMLETFLHANDQFGLHARAVILSRRPERLPRTLLSHEAVETLHGDVRRTLPRLECTHVVHLAMETNVDLSDPPPQAYFATAVDGTRHVLDLAQEGGCRKFLLASSGAVYGQQPEDLERIPEDYPGAPLPEDVHSAYGHGKRAAEFLCAATSDRTRLQTKVARCFAFVGPLLDFDSGFAIGNFIRDAMWGERILVTGDGTPYRSYLYAADLAIWLWTILIKGRTAFPYNVGSEDAVDIRTMAQAVARIAGRQTPVDVLGQPVPGAPPTRYVPDTSRARETLGLESRIGLDEAIERTMLWAAEKAERGVGP